MMKTHVDILLVCIPHKHHSWCACKSQLGRQLNGGFGAGGGETGFLSQQIAALASRFHGTHHSLVCYKYATPEAS